MTVKPATENQHDYANVDVKREMVTGSIKSRQTAITILACHLMIWSGVLALASTATARSDTDPKKVTGPNACAECHKEETEVWRATHHFTTFRNMPRDKEASRIAKKMGIKRIKAKSLCLNCHFTTQKTGKRKKTIAGISCESCHGSGKDWEKLHSEFSGKKKETEEQGRSRKTLGQVGRARHDPAKRHIRSRQELLWLPRGAGGKTRQCRRPSRGQRL